METLRTRERILEEIARSNEKDPQIFITSENWVKRGALFLARATFGETAPESDSTKDFSYSAAIRLFKNVGFPSPDSFYQLTNEQLRRIFDGGTVADIPYGPKVPSSFEIPETVTASSSLFFNTLYNCQGSEKYQLALKY